MTTKPTGPTRDLTGRRFTRLKVLRLGQRRDGRWHWVCRCDCGTEKEVYAGSLVAGLTTSCGCLKRERTSAAHTTHGHSRNRDRTGAYRSWCAMWQRVRSPSEKVRPYYAGVAVCDRWQDFSAFLFDMGERPPGLTLDRTDPFGDYGPENCRWATPAEQAQNQRRHRKQPSV